MKNRKYKNLVNREINAIERFRKIGNLGNRNINLLIPFLVKISKSWKRKLNFSIPFSQLP